MKGSKYWILVGLLLAIITFFACDGGGGSGGGDSAAISSGTGTVSFGLTDTSTDKYQAVYVTINEVQVNRNDSSSDENSSWEVVATPRKTYNLLRLVNGVTETLGEKELTVGIYKQIRLIIGETPESENNIMGLPHPAANYVILDDGSEKPLKIPSGLNTGIKLVHHFEVKEGEVVELVLDFDACRSVVKAGKSGKYILKPTIKVIDTFGKSVVYGKITDNSEKPIIGATVSAQISDGSSATVVRSTLTDSGVTDTGDEIEEDKGNYELLLSPTQSYKIVAFSSEIITGSRMYDPACADVDAPWKDAIRNFTLTSNDLGTISGEVILNGENLNPDFVVYVSIYTDLDCDPEDFSDLSYVEVTTLPISPDSTDDNRIFYSVELPLGNYDVVASAECYIPATQFNVALNTTDPDQVANLTITPRSNCD